MVCQLHAPRVCSQAALLLLQLIFIFFSAVSGSAAQMAFTDQQLTISGLTPSGKVVLFGVSLKPLGYESQIVKTAKVVTADAAGTLSYSVLQRSVWAAVDLTSGALASGAPKESRAEITDLLSETQPIGIGAMSLNRPARFLLVLMVRPATGGVWALDAGDGDDGANPRGDAIVRVSLAKLKALNGDLVAPTRLALGDVLIAIDPHTLHAFTAALPRR